jgi:hypothetical protein
VEELLALSTEEQETLLKRLTHHALCKMRRLTWRGAYVLKGGSVPGGYEPYDFALDAIAKMLDGTRPWNKERYPTLENALRATIDSDISHLVDCPENIKARRLTSAKGETAEVYEIRSSEPNPLTVVIDRDWQDQYHKAAMKELDGDGFLKKLLECLEAEITRPADIAVMLNTTEDEINNGKKRLRRKLEKLDGRFPPPKRRAIA